MTDSTTGLTVTLKAGVGFEAPWIVIHALDAADALRQIDTGAFATLAERTVSAAEFFRAAHTGKQAFPAAKTSVETAPEWNNQGAPPAWGQGSQQQAPPQGAGPACVHGPRVFKSGTSKAGKPYKMWACSSQNRQSQCDPEWVRD